MNELSLSEHDAGAIGITMAEVVFFEWVSRWSAGNAERRSVRKRVTCRLCLLVVEDDGRGRTFRCPHCEAENERGRNRSLG